MATIGQGSSIRNWQNFDQKQMIDLAVAAQWNRSKPTQISNVNSNGSTAFIAEKLRAVALRAGLADSSLHDTTKSIPSTSAGGAMAPGGSTEFMKAQLRSGEDGHTKIIEGLEDTLQGAKQNLLFVKETIKIYEETGEALSVQPNGNFTIDLSDYGGKEKYMKIIYQSAQSLEKYAIPSLMKSVEDAKIGRLELLREYGLAPPAVNTEI